MQATPVHSEETPAAPTAAQAEIVETPPQVPEAPLKDDDKGVPPEAPTSSKPKLLKPARKPLSRQDFHFVDLHFLILIGGQWWSIRVLDTIHLPI